MRFSSLVAAFALAVPTAASSLACAVPDLPPEDTSADDQAGIGTDTAPTKTPPKRSTGTTPPSGGSGGLGTTPAPTPAPASSADASAPPPANSCATAANQDACFRCCDVANPNAMPLLDNAWGDCQCGVPGMCASVCASQYCGGQPTMVGGSCDNCLAANDVSCRTKAETKCAADSTCKPYLTCTNDAKCGSKPM
jgi:hypothetical protein